VRAVVDSGWLAEHLGEDDLVVGDVRGPNAHMRGHIPGSRPLVLGSPPPAADEESARALAQEIALRLRRHGITGRERLVLVDRGDGVGAMPAAQMAELAGHPQVAILLGGIAGWEESSRKEPSSSSTCARRRPTSSRTRARCRRGRSSPVASATRR
jgi:3-mercaptopyruvate sulfurtransferase SseA